METWGLHLAQLVVHLGTPSLSGLQYAPFLTFWEALLPPYLNYLNHWVHEVTLKRSVFEPVTSFHLQLLHHSLASMPPCTPNFRSLLFSKMHIVYPGFIRRIAQIYQSPQVCNTANIGIQGVLNFLVQCLE